MAMNTHQMAQAAQAGAQENAEEVKAKRRIAAPSERAMHLLGKYMEMIKRSLGNKIDPLEFSNAVVNAVATDPNLLKAMDENPASFIGAVIQSAILGLPPNTPMGYAYLLPYNSKDKVASAREGRTVYKWQVNFQLGYRGVLKLVHNSGEVSFVDAEVVYEKDGFDTMLGTERYLRHKPYDGADPGRPVKYYAIFKLKNGEDHFKVWSYEKVYDHAVRFSKSYNQQAQRFFGPWGEHFDGMAKKTVLLDVLNLAPKSTTFAAMLASDNSTKTLPANNSDAANLLMMPNEDFDPSIPQIAADGAADVPQLEVADDPQATAAMVREEFGLKRGSEIGGGKAKARETDLAYAEQR